MAEYIEREAVLEAMCKYCCEYDSENTECICNERLGVLEIPAADVVPVVHGRWTEKERIMYDSMREEDVHWFTYVCSVCAGEVMNNTNYCPNCGAKMNLG